MHGKPLMWFLVAGILAVLFMQMRSGVDRIIASRLLYQVESISLRAVTAGQVSRGLFRQNLRDLRQAAKLDPLEVGIPLALGSQFLLLHSPQAAAEAYREALLLEPRPEIYLNLGKALHVAGHKEEAKVHFQRAVALDWHFEKEIPF